MEDEVMDLMLMRLANTELVWTLSGDMTPDEITQNIRSGKYGVSTNPTDYRFMPVRFKAERELSRGAWAVKHHRSK